MSQNLRQSCSTKTSDLLILQWKVEQYKAYNIDSEFLSISTFKICLHSLCLVCPDPKSNTCLLYIRPIAVALLEPYVHDPAEQLDNP